MLQVTLDARDLFTVPAHVLAARKSEGKCWSAVFRNIFVKICILEQIIANSPTNR